MHDGFWSWQLVLTRSSIKIIKNRAWPDFLMPVSKIKRYKNNNIAKKEQISLKKGLKRPIYLKNITNFVICVVCKKAFYIGL